MFTTQHFTVYPADPENSWAFASCAFPRKASPPQANILLRVKIFGYLSGKSFGNFTISRPFLRVVSGAFFSLKARRRRKFFCSDPDSKQGQRRKRGERGPRPTLSW